MVLDADVTGSSDDTIVFGEGLQLLVAGLTGPVTMFGLTVQRAEATGEVAQTVMGGWRTPGAVWLVDLSDIAAGNVELVLASRELLEEMMGQLLGVEPDPEFAMETPYTADALRQHLSGVATPAAVGGAAEARFCSRCGNELELDWKYCSKCQLPVPDTA